MAILAILSFVLPMAIGLIITWFVCRSAAYSALKKFENQKQIQNSASE